MAIFADNFNRADANLEASPTSSSGGTWTHDGNIAGGLAIASNILRCGTANTTGSAYWAEDHGNKNHYVQFDVVSANNTTGAFWCCRLGDRNNFIGVRAGNNTTAGQVDVFRKVAGTFTQLYVSSGSTAAIGNTVRMEVQNDTWTVYLNGVQLSTGSVGDSGALDANTKSGVVARSIIAGIGDNFETGRVGQIDIAVPVTGTGTTISLGTPSVSVTTSADIDATGNEITASIGDISIGTGVTVSLSGSSATGTVDDVTITAINNLDITPDGVSAVGEAGSVAIVSKNILFPVGFEMQASLGITGLGNWFPINTSAAETWTRINQ